MPDETDPPIDSPPFRGRRSAREKKIAPPAATGDSGVPGAAREDASLLEAALRVLRESESPDRRGVAGARGLRDEQDRLAEWARLQGCLIPDGTLEALPVLSNRTSEHEVRLRSEDGRVVKRTWPGFYGQVPEWRGGEVDRVSATPAQYLARQRLQNDVFGSDIRLEGVNISDGPSMVIGESGGQPAFVVSQAFIDAADDRFPPPSETQIDAFLRDHGFEPIPGSYFGWVRRADGVVVLDARGDNFILAADGVVPIDLQMAQIAELAGATGEA